MLHEKSCLIINMPKIMIIKYQQFAKTNTFSVSFHILFSPFLHIFPQDTSKSGFGDGQKWAKMGLDPPKIDRDTGAGEGKIGRETGAGEGKIGIETGAGERKIGRETGAGGRKDR